MKVADVVAADLCIGCGLCEAVTTGRVSMRMTDAGSLRPWPVDGFVGDEEARILEACPGVVAEARTDSTGVVDPIWGQYSTMRRVWAGDPDVRHAAASGGVLTALAIHLLISGVVEFILHVGPDPAQPMRSRWVISHTPDQVRANTGSRYGPTAPLAGLMIALERGERFAVVAKPCDLGGIHRFARTDSRIDDLCIARLAMVCGGQSRLSKSQALLDDLGVAETDVSLFRYRGYGNPGPIRIETHGGPVYEATYLDMWGEEAGWDLETRCKLCPDALGEAADIAAADAWPGGSPTGEDEGFNVIAVRNPVGERLVASATAAGSLVLGDAVSPREFDALQPHQVRKKVALAARYDGMADAGVAPITTIGLRVGELGTRLDADDRAVERAGTESRIRAAQKGHRP